MKLTHPIVMAVSAVLISSGPSLRAGTSAANKMSVPMAEESFGQITFGGKFSEKLQSGYVDILSGLYHDPNNAVFLNLRGTFDDSDQQILSAGIGVRHLFEDPGIIIGGNMYYDYIDSEHGNGFNQLGLGAEVLTHWVDARYNYYLPENGRHLVRTFTVDQRSRAVTPTFNRNGFVQEQVRDTTVSTKFGIFETALEGWNSEIGFLVPGVDQLFELRLFAGYYSYENSHGRDRISGFKARAEARVTEGIILGVEYWEDEELMGGNWIGEVAVSLPFDIGRLCQGQNPFAGASDVFKFRPARNLHERMDEMVIRSHRIQTSESSPEPLGSTTTTNVTTLPLEPIFTPTKKTAPPKGGGEGEGEGSGEEQPPPET
jgi:hypothetical protein